MKTILDEASEVTKQRQAQHDVPEDNFKRIADFWNSYLENKSSKEITPADVARMMILFKVARDMWKHSVDSSIDMAGYAHCLSRVEGDYDS